MFDQIQTDAFVWILLNESEVNSWTFIGILSLYNAQKS